MALWAVFALTGVTTALLGVPVAPTLFELCKRSDAAPLPASRHDDKITNFAEVFSARLETLRPRLERCASQAEMTRVRVDGTDVLLVGREQFDLTARLARGVSAMMCSHSVTLPEGHVLEADLHTDRTLQLLPHAVLRAGVAGEDAILGSDSAVLRWLHAHGSVHLQPGSTVYGRLSAGRFIHLQAGCVFEHMHAPKIHTVEQENSDGRSPLTCSCFFPQSKCHICEIESNRRPESDDVHDIFASHRRRIRRHGDFALSAHQTLNANVVATGSVRFGPHSRFMGNTKSYKDTFVDEGACVHGSLVCGRNLYLGERSSVAGPLMAEQDVVIGSGARVGRPDALTTIAARNIKIAAGCQLHGTVWARVQGVVEDQFCCHPEQVPHPKPALSQGEGWFW
jgi:cytoskeletal protein CcmA (bactofilin family)